jgi:hypothetical protein
MELTPNHQQLLETVRELVIADRECLTLLCSRERENGERAAFGKHGVEKALNLMVQRGYLSKNLREAFSPRAEIGLSKKRIAYHLAHKGRSLFGFSREDRLKLNRKVANANQRPFADLRHEMGITREHTRALLGERAGCWKAIVIRGERSEIVHEMPGGEKLRARPDLTILFDTFKRFVRYYEFENLNSFSQTLEHARKYMELHKRGVLDGKVVWVTRSTLKMRSLRERLIRELGAEPGTLFVFLAQDQYPLEKPELLLKAELPTTSEKCSPLVPGGNA